MKFSGRSRAASLTGIAFFLALPIALCADTTAPVAAPVKAATAPVSLSGEWRIRIDQAKVGLKEQWFMADLAGEQRIKLPGTIDDAGLGPKNTKPPTLEGPYRLYDYAGPAWYQRDLEVPAEWQGKRMTLFLERCRWVTSVWLDDKFIGSQDSLIAPHVYDFGLGVTPGKHRLTICVDNTVKIDLGSFVSALFGGTWGNMNGIVGRIELAATPPVWIDDVQVYPDLKQRIARVAVKIGNATGRPGRGPLRVAGLRPVTVDAAWDEREGRAEAEVDIQGAKPWDEFAPNLSELTVTLGDDARTVRFGPREFVAQGTQFTLNGRPVFLRGTLECSVFPLTGYPPTDPASWRRIFRIIQSYGLNHMRFHTWCPPEAAFTAADEAGVILQVEGPQTTVAAGVDPQRDAFIEAEYKRIVDTYGNHPSFCLMTLGNEFSGPDALLDRWVKMLIARDPRHLYSSACDRPQSPASRQFSVRSRGRGIQGAGTDRDLRAVVPSEPRPILGHEIGQWMYYPDFNEIGKYSGVMAAKNFELIRADLQKKGQLDLAPRYIQASGRFATLLYKEEIEALLRTPAYAGFALLDLHDYPAQGTALVGPLDAFWDSKGFITPEAFRRFCGPTVPLLRIPKRTYAADEPFVATADLAHYGPADLEPVQATWRITDVRNREIAAGTLPPLTAATGKLTPLGTIQTSFAQATTPGKFTVTLALAGTAISNDWEIWVYPGQAAPPPPADVAVCERWDDAQAALAAGKRVVYFASGANTAGSLKGAYLPVFWSPVWFSTQKPNTMGLLCDPQHPLFAQFPTEFHSNWQWYDLLNRSRSFILDDMPVDYRPLVQVIDNFARNHKLGLIFEGHVGEGRLLVCGIGLPDLAGNPAVRQLLASLYAYAGSSAFAPRQQLDAELLEKLFAAKNINRLGTLDAKITASGNPGPNPPEAVTDAWPTTVWCSAPYVWRGVPDPGFPHHLIVELPKPATLYGITYLLPPASDQRTNPFDCNVYVSADGKDWGQPIAHGDFPKNTGRQSVGFGEPVTTRFLKLVLLHGADSANPSAAIAELDVILAK